MPAVATTATASGSAEAGATAPRAVGTSASGFATMLATAQNAAAEQPPAPTAAQPPGTPAAVANGNQRSPGAAPPPAPGKDGPASPSSHTLAPAQDSAARAASNGLVEPAQSSIPGGATPTGDAVSSPRPTPPERLPQAESLAQEVAGSEKGQAQLRAGAVVGTASAPVLAQSGTPAHPAKDGEDNKSSRAATTAARVGANIDLTASALPVSDATAANAPGPAIAAAAVPGTGALDIEVSDSAEPLPAAKVLPAQPQPSPVVPRDATSDTVAAETPRGAVPVGAPLVAVGRSEVAKGDAGSAAIPTLVGGTATTLPTPAASISEPAYSGSTLPHAADEAGAPVAMRIARAVQDGDRILTMELHPAELGRVEVRLSFHADGVGVQMTLDRPETFEAFSRNRAGLEQQLAQSGIDLGGGGLDLRLGQQSGQQGSEGRPGNFRAVTASAAVSPTVLSPTVVWRGQGLVDIVA